jgi:hypothetical protein
LVGGAVSGDSWTWAGTTGTQRVTFTEWTGEAGPASTGAAIVQVLVPEAQVYGDKQKPPAQQACPCAPQEVPASLVVVFTWHWLRLQTSVP